MTKAHISYFLAPVGTCLVRWLEVLGQSPSPVRDPGIGAWQYLSRRAAGRGGAFMSGGGGPLLDDPHLAVGMS